MKLLLSPSKKTKQLFEKVTGHSAPFAIVVLWKWFFGDVWGVAIGPVIITKRPDDMAHLCHELVHVEQFYNQPLTFWIKYILERRRVGYWSSRYEREAYAVQRKANQQLRSE